MNNRIKFTLLLLCVFSALFVMAQPPAPPATPIDGGLTALLVAGGIYGLKKLRDSRR